MVSGFFFNGVKEKYGRSPGTGLQEPTEFLWDQKNAYEKNRPHGLWKLEVNQTFSPSFFVSAKAAYYYNDGFGLFSRGDGSYFVAGLGGNHELKFGFGYRGTTTNTTTHYGGDQLVGVINSATDELARVQRDGSGGTGAAQPGVDPKDRIAELQAYQRDVRQGMALYRQNDLAAAIRVLSRAARSSTSSFNVNYYLGRTLVESRRFTEAVPHLEKAVGMAPARQSLAGLAVAPVYAYLVEALSGTGRSSEAFRALVEGLAAAPKSADLLRAKGGSLLRQGDLAGAHGALEEARVLDPRDPRLHVELSGLYRNLAELERARAEADEAVGARVPRGPAPGPGAP